MTLEGATQGTGMWIVFSRICPERRQGRVVRKSFSSSHLRRRDERTCAAAERTSTCTEKYSGSAIKERVSGRERYMKLGCQLGTFLLKGREKPGPKSPNKERVWLTTDGSAGVTALMAAIFSMNYGIGFSSPPFFASFKLGNICVFPRPRCRGLYSLRCTLQNRSSKQEIQVHPGPF